MFRLINFRLFPHSLIFVVLLWSISRCLYFIDDGTLATDFPGVWGDWSLHAAHSWWFAEQPFSKWFDARILRFDSVFSYPPLINFMSGMLLRAGFGLQSAMLLPCLVFATILSLCLPLLFRRAGAGPWTAGALAVVFVLAGGTRTITRLVLWDFAQPMVEGINTGLLSQVWMTPLFSLLLPQRTLLAGLSLGCAALLVAMDLKRRTVASGLRSGPLALTLALACLLPLLLLAHVHSWLAVMLVIGVMMLLDFVRSPFVKKDILRHWVAVVGPGLVISMFLIWVTMPAISNKASGIDWAGFWRGSETGQSLIFFWIVNWNVVIPLVLVAAAVSREIRRDPFFLSGAVIFVAMNLVKLQPWAWDNSKLLVWALLLFGISLVRFFSLHKFRSMSWLAAVIVCIDGLVGLGSQMQSPAHRLTLWSSGEQAIAAWARQTLPRDAVILSPSHLDHRYWSYALTGRTNVQAYGGWNWTHGFAVEPLQSRVSIMLGDPSGNLASMKGMGVTHVAVPENVSPIKIGFDGLNRDFKLLGSYENQALFAVP